jgi:hypothetical protein
MWAMLMRHMLRAQGCERLEVAQTNLLEGKSLQPQRKVNKTRDLYKGAFMRAKQRIFARDQFLEKFLISLQRSFFADAPHRGICARQDRPHCEVEVKLTHGVDVQVGSIRPLSPQSP